MVTMGILSTIGAGVLLAMIIWGTKDEDRVTPLIVGIVLFGVTVLGYSMHSVERYKQGQIDSLTGKVKYHLVTKSDSTRVWEKIEKGE